MGRLAIFLDGGYVDASFPRNLNYGRLVEHIRDVTNQDLLRSYLYHCLPPVGPSVEVRRKYEGKKRLFYALERTPRFVVRLGQLVWQGTAFVQKGVDLRLGLDLAFLADRSVVTDIALVSGDGDLAPALEFARNLAVVTWVFHSGSLAESLRKTADEVVDLGDWYLTQEGGDGNGETGDRGGEEDKRGDGV